MGEIRFELGLTRWPSSNKEVNLALEAHFVTKNDDEIVRLSLPALEPPLKRARLSFVDESNESQAIQNNLEFNL